MEKEEVNPKLHILTTCFRVENLDTIAQHIVPGTSISYCVAYRIRWAPESQELFPGADLRDKYLARQMADGRG